MPRLTVCHAPPVPDRTALRNEHALGRLLCPALEVLTDATRISAQRARRAQDHFAVRAPLHIHLRRRKLEPGMMKRHTHPVTPYAPTVRTEHRPCTPCIFASLLVAPAARSFFRFASDLTCIIVPLWVLASTIL